MYKDREPENLIAYCDSDYAGNLDTRKSTTEYVIYYKGGPISWSSKKQPIEALSSTEAEFIAAECCKEFIASECCKELLYLKTVIQELTKKEIIAEMYVDNQSAVKLIKSGVFNKRLKHIDLRYHFIH